MRMNKIIFNLIEADLMINIAAGFVQPVFAIFLLKNIKGGSIQLAGTAIAIYWITKSLLRVPVGYYLDRDHGEKDDFYSIVLGFFIFDISHLLYIFARTPFHIYLIQILLGIGATLAFVPWYGFFTRHIDRFKESFEWSINLALVGGGISLANFLGGVVAQRFGFVVLFILASVISFLGIFFLILIYKKLKIHIEQIEKV